MREIKFRGKRKDIGWKYGYLTIIEKAHEPNLPAIKPLDEEWITYGVDPESVGEYTGLKDKNGKEIYHKDILKDSDIGELWLVEWSNEYAGFELQRITENTIKVKGILEVISACRIVDHEYIGNIHENPELKVK